MSFGEIERYEDIKMTDFKKFYTNYKPWFNAEIKAYELPAFPENLYKPIRYALDGGGKRIRPSLLAAMADSYGIRKEKSLHAAMAIELIHLFSLVHDDIMDGDKLRHGKPTLHVKWDVNTGILSGDAIFTLAFKCLTDKDSPALYRASRIFIQSILDVCEGQSQDLDFETIEDVTEEAYLRMIEQKTGHLLSGAAKIGAVLGGATEEELDLIESVIISVGRAFQLQDDLLELISSSDNMGKSLGSDLIEKKKTFLLINAYKAADKKQRSLLDSMLTPDYIFTNGISSIRKLFDSLGVIDMTISRIRQEAEKTHILSRQLPGPQQKILNSFSSFILNRTK